MIHSKPRAAMPQYKELNLADGNSIPALGLGTWKSGPDEVYKAVRVALEVGYRHIDCAAAYENEGQVGRAIEDAVKAGDVKRDELWVTSKLWNDSHRREHVRPAIEETLENLRLDYLDLYLIHWPVAFVHGVGFPEESDEYLSLDDAPMEDTWDEMAKVRDAERTRYVGLSNVGQQWIERLSESGEMPAVLQIECHPHLQQRDLLSFCNEQGIVVTAYSPLGSGDRKHRKDDEPALLNHPRIEQIADQLDASPAQVLIAWALRRDTVVIPKSTTRSHIESNFEALGVELSADQMGAIETLDKGYRYLDGTFFAGPGSPYRVEDIFK